MRALLIGLALTACASPKPIPTDPTERAAHFAQSVRDAVAAKERAKALFSATEATVDASLREACSQLVALGAFAPDRQEFRDVDAMCRGYLSTPEPAKVEPVVPPVEPEPAEVTDGGSAET